MLRPRGRSHCQSAGSRSGPKRLSERTPKDNADILNRVMIVDVKVAGGSDAEIEKAVACEAIEHVIEKGHAGRDFAAPGTVESKSNRHRGLAGLTLDLRRARRQRDLAIGGCGMVLAPVIGGGGDGA